jgi:hypothetical protein
MTRMTRRTVLKGSAFAMVGSVAMPAILRAHTKRREG